MVRLRGDESGTLTVAHNSLFHCQAAGFVRSTWFDDLLEIELVPIQPDRYNTNDILRLYINGYDIPNTTPNRFVIPRL